MRAGEESDQREPRKQVGMTREYHGIHLTDSFEDSPEGHARATKVLQHYFRPLTGKNAGYTGGAWDRFDPSGTRGNTTEVFTAEDVVACALLSAPIPGRAAVELLDTQQEHFAELLAQVGQDRDFVEVDAPDGPEFQALVALFWNVCALPGVGLTRATKLCARKRPRLVPIVDRVIKRVVFTDGTNHWAPLHRALTANDRHLWTQLEKLKVSADLPEEVPVIRVFDVLAWMDGTGNSVNALNGAEIEVNNIPADE